MQEMRKLKVIVYLYKKRFIKRHEKALSHMVDRLD
jgi:hypothetical protein